MKQPQSIYFWTVIAWLLSLGIHVVWFVRQMRAQPPTDEIYTQTPSFQAAAFTLTILPYWLGALLLILILEFAIFGRMKKNEGK